MYIKVKKVWTKKIKDKEILSLVWDLFKNISPAYDKEWEESKKSMFTKITERYGNFLHPETDVEDDSMGIQPKQIKNWIDNGLKVDSLGNLFFILNHYVRMNKFLQDRYTDEDGFIVWESIWNEYVKDFISEDSLKELSEKYPEDLDFFIIGKVIKKLSSVNHIWPDEIFILIGQNPWLIYFAENQEWRSIYAKRKLTKNAFINFFSDQKKAWLSMHNISPKSAIMLISSPKQFNKEVIQVIDKLYGTKQIASLNFIDQYHVVSLIEYFGGKSLTSIPIDIIQKGKLFKKVGISENLDINVNDMKFFIKSLENAGYQLTIPQLEKYLKVLPSFDKEFLKNLENIENKELLSGSLDLYFELEQVQNLTKEFKQFVWSLDPQWIKYVSRYHSHKVNINQLQQFFRVWEQRSQKNDLPIFNGKVGKYQYKLMDKTKDKEGLFLGYATDCCQVIGGAGGSCMTNGFSNSKESFFVVKKKGKIYAQSWVWEKVNKDGLKIFCFDSIEVLGKDLNDMQDIMNSYLEASTKLVEEHGYDIITVGADGNRIPEGLSDFVESQVNRDEMYERDLIYSGRAGYTDTNSDDGVFILKERVENDN